MRLLIGLITCGVVALLSSSAVRAQPIAVALNPEGQLAGNSAAANDGFGLSMTSNGGFVVVGAPGEQVSRNKQDGAVYVYRRSGAGFVLHQKITVATPVSVEGDRFGAGVLARGGWLFVAMANAQDFPGLTDRPRQNPDLADTPFFFAGKVYVYRLDSGMQWQLVQTLASPFARREGAFGARTRSSHMAISANADMLVIGEPDTYRPVSDTSLGTSRLHVFGLEGRDASQRWVHRNAIELAQDTRDTNFSAGDSIVALPDDRFVIELAAQDLQGPFSDVTKSSQSKLVVYARSGDTLAPAPVQTIDGLRFQAGRCKDEPDIGWTGGGFHGMAAGGDIFAAVQPCADGAGAARKRTGRLDIYTVGPSPNVLNLARSFDGPLAERMMGSSIDGGQESVGVDRGGVRIFVGSTLDSGADANAQPLDARVYVRPNPASAGWRLFKTLARPTAFPPRGFGQAVGFMPQATVFVGKPSTAPSRGAVLVYNLDRPNPLAALPPAPPSPPAPGIVDATPFEKCNLDCDNAKDSCLATARHADCEPLFNACVRRCSP